MSRLLTLSERGVKLTNKWAKYKNGMTTETWNDLKPKLRTKEDYVISAKAYMKVMTGVQYTGVIWDVTATGDAKVRFVTVTKQGESEWDSKKRKYITTQPEVVSKVEIPHWDFTPSVIDNSNDIETELEFDMNYYAIAAE